MKLVTENEAVATFRTLADMACASHEPVFIAREGASPVVLIALDDYQTRNDTEYLLSSSANAARLFKSLADFHAGVPATERELIEP